MLEYVEFTKNCYITFSIFIGIINIALTFILKNVMIGIMNILIYIGMTAYFFDISKDARNEYGNGAAEGVIDIIIIILSAAFVVFTVFKYKGEVMHSSA